MSDDLHVLGIGIQYFPQHWPAAVWAIAETSGRVVAPALSPSRSPLPSTDIIFQALGVIAPYLDFNLCLG